MSNQDFTTTLLVDQRPKEVFSAINNVRSWWPEIQGNTVQLNDESIHHYEDAHRCRIKIIEFIPDKKVVWVVLDNYFNFIKDKSEWTGTKIIFEIVEEDGKTQLHFTHQGLVPQYECYDVCSNAWSDLIRNNLLSLITKAKEHHY
jgi:hypothetical protein